MTLHGPVLVHIQQRINGCWRFVKGNDGNRAWLDVFEAFPQAAQLMREWPQRETRVVSHHLDYCLISQVPEWALL